MKPFFKKHFFGITLLLSVYTVLISYHYYDSKQILLRSAQDNVENLLLYNRAISNFVSHKQRPEVEHLCQTQKNKDFFSPALQSSSYITQKINQYVNRERQNEGLPALQFKWASLNPINPINRANNIEARLIHQLAKNPDLHFNKLIEYDDKIYYYYVISGHKMERSCLRCHQSPDRAPKEMVALYGSSSGYGYKEGDLSSIISIRTDITQSLTQLHTNIVTEGIILLLLLLLGYGFIVWVIHAKQQLERRALRDPLTQLLNRTLYQSTFDETLLYCRHNEYYLAHFLLDIDFFKQYNDTYGHQKGDEVLIKVAKEIEHCFQRTSDFVFRIGGEEFAIICSAKEKQQLIDMGHHLCKSIELLKIEHTSSSIHSVVTVSIGICLIDPSRKVLFRDVYETSDQALYQAKHDGRNRIQIFEL